MHVSLNILQRALRNNPKITIKMYYTGQHYPQIEIRLKMWNIEKQQSENSAPQICYKLDNHFKLCCMIYHSIINRNFCIHSRITIVLKLVQMNLYIVTVV